MRKISVAFCSLFGALAIHAILVACGSSSVPDAVAGTGQASCSNWQISTHYTADVATTPSFGVGNLPGGLGKPISLPTGWEPIGATLWPAPAPDGGFGYGALVTVRHCSDP